MDTPPRAFADDDDVGGYGKTPEPRRQRLENLERKVELLCREKGSLVRKLDADTKRFDSTLKAKMTESEEMRASLSKSQRDLERCKAEGEGMREELDMYAVVAQQKALLALSQEQLQVVELEHRLVLAEQQRVMRDHKIALFHAREAELLSELEERDERIVELEASLSHARTSAKAHIASSAKSASSDLARALDDNAKLSARVDELQGTAASLKAKEKELAKAVTEKEKLLGQVQKLEASVEVWKGKEKEVRAQLDERMTEEESRDGSSDKEIRALKAQLRAAKTDLDAKEGECVDLQEEMATLKEKSKERERELKMKLKEAAAASEQVTSLQEEVDALKLSQKKASADAHRAKVALMEASASVGPEERKKTASPVRAAKVVKEKIRKAATAEPESEAETIPKKTKRTHGSPTAKLTKKASKSAPASEDEAESLPAASPKIRKAPRPSKVVIPKSLPLGESSILNRFAKPAVPVIKRKSIVSDKAPKITVTPADEDVEPDADESAGDKSIGPEKKKKRKLLVNKPAFKWDPILESGSGVIPSTFSPMKPPGAIGSIPRVAFPTSSSSRSLSRI